MTLSVDASVVAKWFVKEQGFEEARGLLAHRIHLHAPDILLAEFANTIWKKVHRREVADPRPYFDELVNLPEIVTLHRGDALIDRAAEIAVEIDHPVYDCLYLACAEVTASALITADRRFAKKLAGRIPDVWHLEDPATAGRIEAAATAVVISREKIHELVAAYETYAATEQFVVDSIPKSGNLKILTPEDPRSIPGFSRQPAARGPGRRPVRRRTGRSARDRVVRSRTFPQLASQSRARQQDGAQRRSRLHGGIRPPLATWIRARDEYPACACSLVGSASARPTRDEQVQHRHLNRCTGSRTRTRRPPSPGTTRWRSPRASPSAGPARSAQSAPAASGRR